MFNLRLALNDNWRFEYKYCISALQYHALRAALHPYARPDAFTLDAPQGRYLVRSLYFDSPDLHAYQEKVDGNCDRVKLRIRTYARDLTENSVLRVEMKARKGVSVEKHGAFISAEQYKTFMQFGHWPATSEPVLLEFERYVHLKGLVPLILVEYRREGFIARAQGDLRFTIDHQVRSAHANSLFPSAPLFRPLRLGAIIFEIKCNKSQPAWLRALVQAHGLRIMANSKFTQGIEATRPELVYPGWSC